MAPKIAFIAAMTALGAAFSGFLYVSRPISYRLDVSYTLANSAATSQPAHLAVAIPTKFGYQLADLRTIQWPGVFRHSSHGSLEIYYFDATVPPGGKAALRLEIVATLRTGNIEWQAPVLPAHQRGGPVPVQHTLGLRLPEGARTVWREEYRDGAWRFVSPPYLVRYLAFADQRVADSALAQMRQATQEVGDSATTHLLISASLPVTEIFAVRQLN